MDGKTEEEQSETKKYIVTEEQRSRNRVADEEGEEGEGKLNDPGSSHKLKQGLSQKYSYFLCLKSSLKPSVHQDRTVSSGYLSMQALTMKED